MMKYAVLGCIVGGIAGALIAIDMIKQELKRGVVTMGRRVYKVTQVREFKRNG